MKMPKLGAWLLHSALSAEECAAFARRIEAWGYRTLWIPESTGRDPLIGSSWLLANTTQLTLATGIANIYARDCLATLNAQYALAEQSGGRFILGLGISHRPLVEGVRGGTYNASPISTMRAYLEKLASLEYAGPAPAVKPLTMIAALGPRMLELARELVDGVHPYNVSPIHTARARELLGSSKLLCPEQKVLLETDPSTARSIARGAIGGTLALPNYRNNYLRMGLTEADLDGGGSDRLVDAIVAWGDEDRIMARLQEHWDAGADQVCIQVLPRDGRITRPADEKILSILSQVL